MLVIDLLFLYSFHLIVTAVAALIVGGGKVKLMGGVLEFEDRGDFLGSLFIFGPVIIITLGLLGFLLQTVISLRK